MIQTNGYIVSVYLKSPEAIFYETSTQRKSKEAMRHDDEQLYVEHHLDVCREAKNIVVIDPNKRDLLYCQDKEGIKE